MEKTKSLGKGESCMKLTVFIVAVFILVGCSSEKKAEVSPNKGSDTYNSDDIEKNEQNDYIAEDEQGVKTAFLSPGIVSSKNEQAQISYNLGTRCLRENRLEEAEEYLKEAIDLDPLFVDAMDHLGMVYRRQNRLPEAEEIYLKSIEINNTNKVPYQNLAIVYEMQNKLNDAYQLYKKILQLDENDPEGYYGIARLFLNVEEYQKAIPYFDKAIELYIENNSPYVYDAFHGIGLAYYGMNEYDEALMYLEEALIGMPDNAGIKKIINEIRNKQ